MGGFFEGKPYEYFNNLPQYQQDLQANVSGLASQQLGQPNTAMPAQMYQDVMRAYAPNQSMYSALGTIFNMLTGQPGTNAALPVMMSNYQPTGAPIAYTPGDQTQGGSPDWSGWNKQFDDPDREVWRPGGDQVPGGPGKYYDPDNPDAGGPRSRNNYTPIRNGGR